MWTKYFKQLNDFWEELDKFKCLEAKCREKPWKVRARTYGTKSPSRSEALRFIDSAKSPSTKIDGLLVNFRLESLRLKFTNEPSIFVDGDLAESIKHSASDRQGDLVP